MHLDEIAVRAVQSEWFRATAAGDLDALLSLMAEDVVFLTAGRSPFGREQFAHGFRSGIAACTMQCDGNMEYVEIQGDNAVARSHLRVTVTPRGDAPPRVMSGYALSVFRRLPSGKWVLAHDANLLTPEAIAA